MAFKSRFPLIEWSAVEDYIYKYPRYKEQAQQLIKQKLGFTPNLQASRNIEIGMRHSLYLLETGKISQEKFNTELHNCTLMIKKNILRRVPEQAHLVNSQNAKQSFIAVN